MALGLRTALTVASPGKARAKLSILIYHRVLSEPDPLAFGDPDIDTFRWQMRLLASNFHVLPLHEAALRLREGTLPARAASVTFDDGYADNYTVALPTLRELGIPATFFVATGYLNGGCMFNDVLIEVARRVPPPTCDLSSLGLGQHPVASLSDRRLLATKLIHHFKYLAPSTRATLATELAELLDVAPPDLMLTFDQLRALHAQRMQIGAHTHSHPILTQQSAEEAEQDIRLGKERLEALLQTPINVFAYPNGRPAKDYNEAHVAMVKRCGFDVAVSTRPAAADSACDILQLPRFTPWDRTPMRFGLRLLRNLVSPGIGTG